MYENLRSIREKKGFTQEDMAKLLGCETKNAYSLKERGKRKFTLEEAVLISKTFKLSIEEIFFNDNVTILITESIKENQKGA